MEKRYTNEQLMQLNFEELCDVKPSNLKEYPPVRGIGFPYIVEYSCKFCGQKLEGTERSVKYPNKSKPVLCPYCNKMLWNPEGTNRIRKSAYKKGHFELERKKSFLNHLKNSAKRKVFSE